MLKNIAINLRYEDSCYYLMFEISKEEYSLIKELEEEGIAAIGIKAQSTVNIKMKRLIGISLSSMMFYGSISEMHESLMKDIAYRIPGTIDSYRCYAVPTSILNNTDEYKEVNHASCFDSIMCAYSRIGHPEYVAVFKVHEKQYEKIKEEITFVEL